MARKPKGGWPRRYWERLKKYQVWRAQRWDDRRQANHERVLTRSAGSEALEDRRPECRPPAWYGLSRPHKRRIDQMLNQEPGLQLIGSDHVGDDEIVCSVIS
jgi:hypothetical protein